MAQVNSPSVMPEVGEDEKLQKKFTWQFFHKCVLILLQIALFYVLSIGLTFYQRSFLSRYRIPFITISGHLSLKFLLALLFRTIYYLWKGKRRITLTWKQTTKVALTGISGGLDIGFSNWGLSLITVSLYTMTKSASVIAVLVFALMLGLEKLSWSIVQIVGLISIGLILFTYKVTQFHFIGFLLVLLACVFSGIRWTTTQFVSHKKNLNMKNPIDLTYYIQPWMLLATLPMAFIFESVKIIRIWNEADTNPTYLIIYICIGGLIAFSLEQSQYLLLVNTTSLTLSIAGVAKEIFQISIGHLWALDEMSLINFFGLVIGLCGVAAHIVYKTKRMHDVIVSEVTKDNETQLESSQPQSSQPQSSQPQSSQPQSSQPQSSQP